MRREYKLSDKQYRKLLDSCKPVPYMVIGGVPPRSPQENANLAWKELGDELNFDYMSVRPVHGKNEMYFTAESNGSLIAPEGE